jgi:hypothetical protein
VRALRAAIIGEQSLLFLEFIHSRTSWNRIRRWRNLGIHIVDSQWIRLFALTNYVEKAAQHHKEAAKHHEEGKHETAGHHAHIAHGHHLNATHHSEEAVKYHLEQHGEKK